MKKVLLSLIAFLPFLAFGQTSVTYDNVTVRQKTTSPIYIVKNGSKIDTTATKEDVRNHKSSWNSDSVRYASKTYTQKQIGDTSHILRSKIDSKISVETDPIWVADRPYFVQKSDTNTFVVTPHYLATHSQTSESDPIYTASPASGISTLNINNWNSLISFPGFGTSNTTAARGDHLHTGVYQPVGSYLTTESDPVYSGSAAAGITGANISSWNNKLTRSTTTVSNPDSVWVVVDGTAQRAGVTSIPYGYYTNINASGAGYNLTNTSAFLDFGNTDPQIGITQAGTWKIQAGVYLNYVSATVSSQTVTFKLRRTNNSASDIIVSPTLNLTPCTSTTGYGTFIQLPPVWYSTANTSDAIQLWGSISSSLSAGNIQVVGAWITAEKIYE